MNLAQFLQDQILGEVGILVLVDHDIVEPAADRLQSLRTVAQQYVHVQQNIVEVHDPGGAHHGLVAHVDVADAGFLSVGVVGLGGRVTHVALGRHQIVLGHRYSGEHVLRLVDLVVEAEFLDAALDGAGRVARVIDGKRRRIADAVGELAEEADEYRVEGPHVKSAGLSLPHHHRNSFFHLAGGLLREGKRQYPGRIFSAGQYVSYSACEYSCLSRPRTGDYEHRSFRTADSLPLLTVKPLQNLIVFILHHNVIFGSNLL